MKLKNCFLIIILFSSILGFKNIYSQTPVAYYPFNGNANDVSGNGNHGTVNGATLTTDRFGNTNSAYSFNGTSNYIEVPSSVSLQSPGITNAITQSAWIKPIVASTITMKSTGGSFSYSMGMNMTTIGQNYNDYSVNYGSSFTFIPNTWYFVAVTFDGTTMSNYVNGILLSSAVSTHTISSNTSPLVIGADFPGLVEYFQGDIDELKIYNTALTATQIEQNYINSASSLIAYYPFTGNSADSSGYANHGTVNGATLTADRFGNANSAYSFNGTSNYIEVPSSVSLQSPSITNAITQTAWIKPIGGNTITMKSNTSSGPSSYGMGFDIDALIQMYNNYSNNLRSSFTFIPNTWYFVAVTYDGIIMRNYINGNLISSSVSNHTIGSNSLPLIIGADYFGILEYYQGDIDELKIYNTALTATQIANEFGTSVFPTSAGANDFCNPYNSTPSISTGTPYAASGFANINTHTDTIKQNNLSATYQTGEPIASCGSAGIINKTTWTKFVAPLCATPQIIISTDDRSTTNFDTRISAYRRVSPTVCTGGYTEIACSDNDLHPNNTGATNNSTILLTPANGTPASNEYILGETVYVQTSGVGSASGDYGLIIDLEPSVPIVTSVGAGSAVIDWSAINTMGSITGTYIQWRVQGAGPTVSGTYRYITGATNTTITGLTPGITYEYWASYVCASGGRWWSKKGTFTTNIDCIGGVNPSIVSVVAGSPSCNKPVVNFDATSIVYSSYKIARRKVGTTSIALSSTFYPSPITQSFTNTSLIIGATYEFWIIGYCGTIAAYNSPITTFTVCSALRQTNVEIIEDKNIAYILPNGDVIQGLAFNEIALPVDVNSSHEEIIELQKMNLNSSLMEDSKSIELAIYPNPAVTEAIITYTSKMPFETIQVVLYDAFGKQLFNETINNAKTSGNVKINLNDYEEGVYFIKLATNSFSETKKIIVQKN
jgi:hypothetical protein